jgi:hypothetical protein
LTKAFNDLGYVEGKTIQLEYRFPAGQPERFATLAREPVERKVDVIVAVAGIGGKGPNKQPHDPHRAGFSAAPANPATNPVFLRSSILT